MKALRPPINPRDGNPRSTSDTLMQLNQVLKAIETERENLSRAESLLGCLAVAMEYGEMSHNEPYYPDLVLMARKMLRNSISALDSINLPSPSRDKVSEEFSADASMPASALLEVLLLPRPAFPLARRYPLRLHRRNYARAAARAALSEDSACTNISG